MLQPANRQLLTDMLQPPRHFELLQAVGTTFTLDLATALSIPLALTAHGHETEASQETDIIAALMQQSDRLIIVSQAGEIRAGVDTELVALLEEVVYTVQPKAGIFHPKIWVLEYGRGEERRYRFLSLSRNLTEDRSWDLAVRLDGTLPEHADTPEHTSFNAPLSDFVRQIPELVTGPGMPVAKQARIRALADTIRHVSWELPEGITELGFHVLGLRPNAHEPMFQRPASDTLVVSPFLTKAALTAVAHNSNRTLTVLSRPESFDGLGTIPGNMTPLVFEEFPDECSEGSDSQLVEYAAAPLHGLHAKAIFMRDRSHWSRATAFIGSANVTSGGFFENIECMVELRGQNRTIGPETVRESMEAMLQTYTPADTPEQEDTIAETREALGRIMRELAATSFHARVSGSGPYALDVWASPETQELLNSVLGPETRFSWALLTGTTQEGYLPSHEAEARRILHLRIGEITPFLRLSLTQEVDGEPVRVSSIVHAQLHDDIEDRFYRIIAERIGDTGTFLRLLALLLNPTQFGTVRLGTLRESGEGGWDATGILSGLFESLLQALALGDAGLDRAHRVLTHLQQLSTEELALPAGFEQLWNNVLSVRQEQLESSRI